AQLPQTGPDPLLLTHRVTGRDRFDQLLQRSYDGRIFFSTGGRPPPGRRCRRLIGASANDPATSSWPRRIVFSSRPVIWDTSTAPPCPRRFASTAAYHRRSASPRRLNSRFICSCRRRSGWASPAWQRGHWQAWTSIEFMNPTRPAGCRLRHPSRRPTTRPDLTPQNGKLILDGP